MADHQSGQWAIPHGKLLAGAAISALASLGVAWIGPKLGLKLSDATWNIIATITFVAIFAVWGLLRRFGGALLRLARRRLSLVKASGTKLTIVIAALEDDSGAQTHHVERTLRKQFGSAVEVLRSPVSIAVKAPSVEEQKKQATKLLTNHRADVAIWGTHYADKNLIELNFLGKGQAQESGDRYALDDKLLLKDDFGADIGAQIAIQATLIAAPAFDGGHYVVDLLRPAVERLSHIVKNPPTNLTNDARGRISFHFAAACLTIGNQAGDNGFLVRAIEAYRAALKEYTHERVPLDWAMTQNNLGNTLQTLGERESGTARLEEAVTAYREALQEITRDRVPLQWATTQNNLGAALQALGERENSTARLEEAVTAYCAALQEYTRERMPLQWAMTQNNLGLALGTLGERESDTERLEEAVTSYRAALQEYTRERVPLDWAMTQNNLGNALAIYGGRENSTARLEEAITSYRAALQEYTHERVPLQWAATQNNLGNALATYGKRESGTARLEEAVTAYRAALQEYTRERVPLQWAATQNNLGIALRALVERESGTERLEEAVVAFKAALEEWTEECHPYGFEIATRNLAAAEKLLAERRGG